MATRIASSKVLLIQYGVTMTVEQFRDAFCPGLTMKAIRNRASRGDIPAITDGVMDTQAVGDWWESRCAASVPEAA